jgi:5-methylcytosine-specific restriction protein A
LRRKDLRNTVATSIEEWSVFSPGRVYRRADLHNLFGGQRQGGISTPAHHALIFLFTGESGAQHGYSDGWQGSHFYYSGEGQYGDMEFARGNAAIRDHAAESKELHVFQQMGKGDVKYIGEMKCVRFREQRAPDSKGEMRRAIVFELAPVIKETAL